jgi:putative ABC transport system permease protein
VNSLTTAFGLAWAYLRQRPLSTLLNVLLLGLGVGTVIALILVLNQAEERMERDTAGVDLVIGAKGSPLQLVLSAVFQMDVPTGNVTLADAAPIIALPQVKRAVPLALGDSFKSFRIVGTNSEYAELYGATIHEGRFWTQSQEVVIGADVVRATGLKIGQSFASSHGLTEGGGAHAEHPFIVVGTLKPTGTVADRLILTDVESVWDVHAHDDEKGKENEQNANKEITAYLIQYSTPLAAASFPRMVNQSSAMQAASPAIETSRLFALLGIGVTTLKVFAGIMIACAALGIFIGLTNALNERRADLALLRLLGASPTTVFLTIALQGFALGLLGVILGVVLGHVGAAWTGGIIQKTHHLSLTGWVFFKQEGAVIGAALMLSFFAALVPAWRAYRDAVPETLNDA